MALAKHTKRHIKCTGVPIAHRNKKPKGPRSNKVGNLGAVAGCNARRTTRRSASTASGGQRGSAPGTASKITYLIAARVLNLGFNSRRILPACTFSKPDAQHRADTPSPGRWRGAEYYAHADKSMDWRDGMPEGLSTGDMSCFGRGACTGTACHGLSTRSGGICPECNKHLRGSSHLSLSGHNGELRTVLIVGLYRTAHENFPRKRTIRTARVDTVG